MLDKHAHTYAAHKSCVKKTMTLFNCATVNKKNKKIRKCQRVTIRKSTKMCHKIIRNLRKQSMVDVFRPSYALKEMRYCLMTHDWLCLQRLFPYLFFLQQTSNPLLWRYILTIILHSPFSDWSHLAKFMDECLGCQNENHINLIQLLIALTRD
ncbi:uncharacterized protein LOC106641737 [Copidosoma floridanum]|uniref:uncharacterized protein LOC106641737 n=1 Tax=Copidosoma floridanum TaxID=29053 RepID=UPI0006C98A13|nr:uncharacterized protein LOC106641737 [Copidosoma floridanum]